MALTSSMRGPVGPSLLALLALVCPVRDASAAFGNGYSSRRVIDITDAQVSGGPHTNFPVLISTTLPDLKTTANGGKVTDAQGDDIIFTDIDGTTLLGDAVESYNPTTGELTAWVRVPSLASTSVIYLYYGNSAVTTFQGNVTSNGVTGVWDANYKGVWHLNDAAGLSGADSTLNANQCNLQGAPTAAAGQINAGMSLNGTSQYCSFVSKIGLTSLTLSCWIYKTDDGSLQRRMLGNGGGGGGFAFDNNSFQNWLALLESGGNGVELDTGPPYLNGWHYVVATYDNPSSSTSLYKDGVSAGASVRAMDFSGASGFTYIGAANGPTDYFKGTIDEVRVSNAPRSAGWIATEYNNQQFPAGFFTVGVEDTGGVVYDNKGTGAGGFGTSGSFSITLGSAANRAVLLAFSGDTDTTGLTCTVGGEPLTIVPGSNGLKTVSLGKATSLTGTQTVACSWTTAQLWAMNALSFTGVDPTTPFNGGNNASGTSPLSLTITSMPGDLTTTTATGQTASPTTNQSVEYCCTGYSIWDVGPGTGTTTHTWTNGADSMFVTGVNVVRLDPVNNFLVEAAGGGNLGPQAAGTPFTIKITARDASNGTVTGFTGTVNLTSTGTLSAGGGTTAAFTAGVLTSASVTISNTGTFTLTATRTSGGAQAGTSNAFPVNPGALNHFLVEAIGGGNIGSQTAGTPFNIKVTARDANDNVLGSGPTAFASTVDLTSTGTLSAGGGTTPAFTAGVLASTSVTLSNTGSFTLTATRTAGSEAGTSNAFTVNAGAFAKMQVLVPGETAAPGTPTGKTGTPAAHTAGTPFSVTVRAVDAWWNPVSSTHTVGLTSSDLGAVLPASAALVAGNQTFNVTLRTAGTATVTATNLTDGTKAPDTSPPITVNAGTASQLALTVQPANTPAGATIVPAVQVSVQDAVGNTVTSSAASIALAIGANPGGGTLTGTNPVAAVSGVASFGNLSIDKSGAGYTLTASAAGLTAATSLSFDVVVGTATHLGFAVQPANALAGAAVTPTVVVLDALGNTVASSTATLTVALGVNPSGGTLVGTNPLGAVAGTAAFADLSIDKAGVGYTLVATSPGLAAATSVAFDISAGVPAKLAFTAQPSSAPAGSTLNPAVSVAVQDALGNTNTTSTASIALAFGANPGGATLSGTSPVSAISGVAIFTNLSIDKAGTGYTLVASSAGLTSATSTGFDIAAGAATKLVFTVQPTSSAAGAAVAPAVVVTVEDALGNVDTASTANISLALGANPGGSALSGTASQTASGGVATFSNLSLDRVGTGYTLAASSGGLAGATSAAFDISAGAPAQLAFLAQPANATAGAALTPSVVVQDALGNLVGTSGDTVTVALGNNPGGGTLSGTNPVAAVGGLAAFTDLSVDKVATGYTLVAAASGLVGATSAPFDITAGAAARLAFLAQPSSALAGTALFPSVQVAVLDALGNAVASSTASVALALGNNPGGGLLSGANPENAVGGVASFADLSVDKVGAGYTLVASSAGLAGATSAPFDIGGAAVAKVAFVTQPSAVAAGSVISPAVQVTVQDAFGNTDISSTASITVALGANPGGSVLGGVATASAVGGVATFADLTLDRVGVGYTVAATSAGLAGTTSAAFDVTAGPASKLAFALQPSSTTGGAPLSVSVEVLDVNGNLVPASGAAVVLAIGTNPGGGALSGPATVTAVGGLATFTGLSIDKSGVGYTLTASSTGLTGATSTAFDISAGGAARLAFVVNPVTTVAGSTLTPAVVVAVQDSAGNTVASSTANVAVALGANPGNASLGGAGAATANTGIATFADLSLDRAGIGYTLTASAPGLGPATSATFDITSGAVAKLVFVVQPSNGQQSSPLSPAVQVAVQDALGNTVPEAAATIALAFQDNPGLATLSGTTSAETVDGVATFSDVSLNREGAGYALKASSAGMADVTSDAFDIVRPPEKTYLLGCSCQSEGGAGFGIWGFLGLAALARKARRQLRRRPQ